MKCSVCGSESKPNAKFCAQCGATLKAAIESVPESPIYGAGALATAAAPTAAAGVATLPSHTARVVGLILLLAAIGVVGYFGYRVLVPDEPAKRVVTAEAPKPPPVFARATDSAKEAPAAVSAVPESAKAETAAAPPPAMTPAPEVAKVATPAGAPPKVRAAPPRPAASPPAKTASPPAKTATPPATAATPAAPPSPPAAVAPAARVAAAVPAAPPPDRWQMMKDEYARCANEDLFSRVVCEQRVGLKYCDGYWGKVPQCPGKP